MIKHLFIFLTLLLTVGSLKAQMVPNFVAEDINGESHNLYSYLNEEKVVIVDVFASWCTGCWVNLQDEHLANLYKTYGPEGTDELMVLFVEIDPETSDDTLFEDNPFGNWTENIPYPILNPDQLDTTFIQAFAGNGVPTINVICPTTRENIADIFALELSEIIETIQVCNSISNVVDLQILGEREEAQSFCLETDIKFDVLNTGTDVVENFKVSAFDNGGVLINDFSFHGELEVGYSISLNLGEFSLPEVLNNQEVNLLIDINDNVPNNNTQTINYMRAPEVVNELTLSIRSDFWVEQDNTRWWIENSAGQIVTPITQLESLSENEYSFFLENNDCFTFVITEDFGDGIVTGAITLYDDQGNILYDEENFGTRGEGSFEYLGSSVTSAASLDEEQYQLDIYPNLVLNDLQIQYQIESGLSTKLSIYNAQGRQVYTSSLDVSQHLNTTSVNVQDFPQGIYFASIENVQGILTRKFVKQ